MLGLRQSATGELLDLPQPVAQGLLVNMQVGGGQLPRPVAGQHDPERVQVARAVLGILGDQGTEDPRHQGLGLGRAPRQQQRSLVTVPDDCLVLRLGGAQRPSGLLRRVGQTACRGDAVAAADRAGWLSCGRDEVDLHRSLGQHHMQQAIQGQQQMGNPRSRELAVQADALAAGVRPGDGEHAGGQVQPDVRDLQLGDPRIDPAVKELAQQFRAEPSLSFPRGR